MTNRAAFLLTPTETPFLRDRMLYSPRLKEDCCLINTRDVLNPSKTHRPPSFKVNKEKGIKIEEGRPGKHEVVRLETYRKCIIARFYPLQNVNREKATCIKLQVPREQNETIVVDGTVLFQYFQKEGKNVVRMCRFDDETFADRPVAEYFVTDTTPALSSPEFLHFSAQPPKDGEEDTFVIVDVLQSIYVFHRAGVWRVFRKRYPKREKNIAPYKFCSSATVNDRFFILHSFSQQQKEEMSKEQRLAAVMTPFFLESMEWSIRSLWKTRYKFDDSPTHYPNVETRISGDSKYVVVSGSCLHDGCSQTHSVFIPTGRFYPMSKVAIEFFNERLAAKREKLRLRKDKENRYIGPNGHPLVDPRELPLLPATALGCSSTDLEAAAEGEQSTIILPTTEAPQGEDVHGCTRSAEDSVPLKRRKLCPSSEQAPQEADVPTQENSIPPPIKVNLMEEEPPSGDGEVKMEKESPQVVCHALEGNRQSAASVEVPKDTSCEMDTEPLPKSEDSLSEGTSSPPEGRPSATPEEESNRNALERSESDLQKECSQGALSPSNGDKMEGLEKTDPEGESSTDSTPECIATLLATLVETVDSMNATPDQELLSPAASPLESVPEEECGLLTPASVLTEVQPAVEPTAELSAAFEENEPGSASQKSDKQSRTNRKRKLTSPTDLERHYMEPIISLDVELSRSLEAEKQLATEGTFREAMQKESCSSTIHVQAISPVTPQEDTSTEAAGPQKLICSQPAALEDQPMSQTAIFQDWGNEVQENTPPALNDHSAMEKDGIINDVFLDVAEEVLMNSEEDLGTLPSLESSVEVEKEFARAESHLTTEVTFPEAMQKESCTSTIQVRVISPRREPSRKPSATFTENEPGSALQKTFVPTNRKRKQTSATHLERGYEQIITLDIESSKSFEAAEGKHMEGFVEVEFAREESHLATEGTFREAFPKESCSSTIQVQVIAPVTPQEDTSNGAAGPQEPICSHPVALKDQPVYQIPRIEDSANEVQENAPPTLHDQSAMERDGIINDVFLGAAEENSMDSMEYASSTPSPTDGNLDETTSNYLLGFTTIQSDEEEIQRAASSPGDSGCMTQRSTDSVHLESSPEVSRDSVIQSPSTFIIPQHHIPMDPLPLEGPFNALRIDEDLAEPAGESMPVLEVNPVSEEEAEIAYEDPNRHEMSSTETVAYIDDNFLPTQSLLMSLVQHQIDIQNLQEPLPGPSTPVQNGEPSADPPSYDPIPQERLEESLLEQNIQLGLELAALASQPSIPPVFQAPLPSIPSIQSSQGVIPEQVDQNQQLNLLGFNSNPLAGWMPNLPGTVDDIMHRQLLEQAEMIRANLVMNQHVQRPPTFSEPPPTAAQEQFFHFMRNTIAAGITAIQPNPYAQAAAHLQVGAGPAPGVFYGSPPLNNNQFLQLQNPVFHSGPSTVPLQNAMNFYAPGNPYSYQPQPSVPPTSAPQNPGAVEPALRLNQYAPMGLQTPPWNHAFNPAPPGFFDHRSGFNLNILSPGVQPTRNDIPGTVIQAQRLPTVPQQGPSLNGPLFRAESFHEPERLRPYSEAIINVERTFNRPASSQIIEHVRQEPCPNKKKESTKRASKSTAREASERSTAAKVTVGERSLSIDQQPGPSNPVEIYEDITDDDLDTPAPRNGASTLEDERAERRMSYRHRRRRNRHEEAEEAERKKKASQKKNKNVQIERSCPETSRSNEYGSTQRIQVPREPSQVRSHPSVSNGTERITHAVPNGFLNHRHQMDQNHVFLLARQPEFQDRMDTMQQQLEGLQIQRTGLESDRLTSDLRMRWLLAANPAGRERAELERWKAAQTRRSWNELRQGAGTTQRRSDLPAFY